MFSFHLDRTNVYANANYSENFKFVDVDCPHKIAKITHHFVGSPIIWQNGRRKKEMFLKANWIGLDFDNGAISLEDAIYEFREFTHVIGTSRNHRLEKPKKKNPSIKEKAHDRFHVFLRLPETVSSRIDYEGILRFYVEEYHCDRNAVDAARKFNPCREIVSVVEGKTIPIRKKNKYYAPPKQATPESGVPRWVLQLLQYGPHFGESRNLACFKVAVNLKNIFSQERIVDMIMNSKIPISMDVRDEVERAVRSAFNY